VIVIINTINITEACIVVLCLFCVHNDLLSCGWCGNLYADFILQFPPTSRKRLVNVVIFIKLCSQFQCSTAIPTKLKLYHIIFWQQHSHTKVLLIGNSYTYYDWRLCLFYYYEMFVCLFAWCL